MALYFLTILSYSMKGENMAFYSPLADREKVL